MQVPTEVTADESNEQFGGRQPRPTPSTAGSRRLLAGGAITGLSPNKSATRKLRSADARRSASIRLASATMSTDASHDSHYRLQLPGRHHHLGSKAELEAAASEAVAQADAVTAVISPRVSVEMTPVKTDGIVLQSIKVAGGAESPWPATGEPGFQQVLLRKKYTDDTHSLVLAS